MFFNGVYLAIFLQGPYLLATCMYPSNVVVPSKGWFIYGGYYSNAVINAQQLHSISSKWTLGPVQFNSRLDFGQCIVQV
jgi:hypothetical protein